MYQLERAGGTLPDVTDDERLQGAAILGTILELLAENDASANSLVEENRAFLLRVFPGEVMEDMVTTTLDFDYPEALQFGRRILENLNDGEAAP